MAEEATGVLEAMADESWIPWAERVIPNIALWVREWAVAKDHEEHMKKVQEEAV